MLFDDIEIIRIAAEKAAERNGVAFYILCDPSRKQKQYTAVTSVGFGLPEGYYIEERISPLNEREEIDPPEKTSTNGF